MKLRTTLIASCVIGPLVAVAQLSIPFAATNIVGATSSSSITNKHFGSVGFFGGSYAGFFSIRRNSNTGANDINPPAVNFISSDFQLQAGDHSELKVNATDVSGIAQVKIFYRPIASSDARKDFKSSVITSTSSIYGVDVPDLIDPDNWYDAMGMEYYFEVTDMSGNKRREPSDGTNRQAFLKTSDSRIPIQSFGGKQSNYRIISIPYTLTSTTLGNYVNGVLGLPDRNVYRIFSYRGDFIEYPNFNTIARGEGYFLIIRTQTPFIADGLPFNSQSAPPNHRNELYRLRLKHGWNLIGNPYTVPINWNDVKAYNNSTSLNNLYSFKGYYEVASELPAFEGGFVYLDQSQDVEIEIPFKGQGSAGGRVEREASANQIGVSSWSIALSVKQGEMENRISGFGMNPDATPGKDAFDGLNPPRFSEYLEIQFPHKDFSLENFSLDIVSPQDSYEWNFTVISSGNEKTELSWKDGIASNGFELFLYDMEKNVVVDMLSATSYSFSLHQQRKFRIYYGHDVRKKINPERFFVKQPYPNPFVQDDGITFDLGIPRNANANTASLYISNHVGQLVHAEVVSVSEGVSSIKWHGKGSDGETLQPGIYFYQLNLGNQKFTGKVLLLAGENR